MTTANSLALELDRRELTRVERPDRPLKPLQPETDSPDMDRAFARWVANRAPSLERRERLRAAMLRMRARRAR